MARKKTINAKTITEMYMDYFLMNNEAPKSVYHFAQLNNFNEKDFYQFFGNFMSVEQYIFKSFFDETHALLEKSDEYASFDARNKLLSFYFTFFEFLSANRSFVLLLLQHHTQHWYTIAALSTLKKEFQKYVKELEIETLDLKERRLEKFKEKSIEQTSWMQLLMTIRFWMEDASPSFEKTDVFIEKTINTGFDLLDVKPLKSVIDLGKFIFNEKINMN